MSAAASIPLARAPILGREVELSKIDEAFANGATIVTLLGPPGMGKTRLATRAIEVWVERGESARFCDVSEARDGAALLHVIAGCLAPARSGAPLTGAGEVGELLATFGRVLFVMDNFEQVVSAAALVRELVAAAPASRILVTSRERLAIEGEVTVELGPLAPAEAARLFRERAAAAGGGVGAEPAVVETLVARLDGIPLALELAAARTRVMSAAQILARLDERFDVLRRSRGGGRHATLATAIDASWELLDATERRALAELSVFAGSFTMEAAEAVLSAEADVLQSLPALRDKSLVHMPEPGRLALFVSIREYVAAKLAAFPPPDVARLRARHALHYGERARALNMSRLFQGKEPDSALRRALLDERDQLLAALEWARLDDASLDSFVELACAVTMLYLAPGGRCLELLDQALVAIRARGVGERLLRLLLSRQWLRCSLGRFSESRADLAEILATPSLPPALRALTLNNQGIQERLESRYRAAWECHVAADAVLVGLELPRLSAMNTACMGRLQCDFGDERLGRDYNERARAIAIELGDRWLEALVLGNLAQLEQEHGHFDRAREYLVLTLERLREVREPLYLGVYQGVFGDLCFETEAVVEARVAYGEAAGFFSRWRAHRQGVALYSAWGALEARHGERGISEEHFARARRMAELCDSPTVRLLLELHQGALALRVARDRGGPAELAVVEASLGSRRDELASGIGDLGADGERGTVACSIDVRFALRMLTQALAPKSDAPLAALVIAKNGAWFELRDGRKGAKVDLLRRGPLQRLVAALAEAHALQRGVAVPATSLVEAGWPGEKLLVDAAATRLRVAIATLRKMGLRDHLRTGPSGYLLDPGAPIERV